MTTMIQHSQLAFRAQQQQQHHHQENQDLVTLNNQAQSKMRYSKNQDVWTCPQEWQQQQAPPLVNSPYYYSYQQYPTPPHLYHSPTPPRPQRPRTQSNTSNSNIQPQKSVSTPTSPLQQRQRKPRVKNSTTDSSKRPMSMLMQQPPSARPIPMPSTSNSTSVNSIKLVSSLDSSSGRRSSITSTCSTVSQSVSIRSEMSLGTKLSLSKRLRKVFSVSSLRSSANGSLAGASSSNVSLAQDIIPEEPGQPTHGNLRRRSFASLSTLFQKSSSSSRPSLAPIPSPPCDKKDRPSLHVDTLVKPPSFKGRSPVIAPDSPHSIVSTPHRPELPSPTPSTTTDSDDTGLADDFSDLAMAPPPVIGVHYGLPMHGSPRLKPASSSTSSLVDAPRRQLQFCPTVQVHETFAAADYDRKCDTNATCQKLTPSLALKIKQEINEFKLTEMDVHIDSRQYTQFFL